MVLRLMDARALSLRRAADQLGRAGVDDRDDDFGRKVAQTGAGTAPEILADDTIVARLRC